MTTCQLLFKYGKVIYYIKIFHRETSKVSASNGKSLLVLPASFYTEKYYSLGEIELASLALESGWFLCQLTPKHEILCSVYIFFYSKK